MFCPFLYKFISPPFEGRVPKMAVSKIVQTIKSITAREVFPIYPEIKEDLWEGNFWTSGFYANTVDQYGIKEVIKRHVENQGRKYKSLHSEQLKLRSQIPRSLLRRHSLCTLINRYFSLIRT